MLQFQNVFVSICTSRPSIHLKSPYVADISLCDTSYLAHSPALGMDGYISKDKHVLVQKKNDPKAKCSYGILAVLNNNVWVGANPLHANSLFKSGLLNNTFPHFRNPYNIKSESVLDHSRFDFFINNDTYIEVKSCLIKKDNVAVFPVGNKKNGTISERANKHVSHLSEISPHFKTFIVFMILRDDVDSFSPNKIKDPLFHSILHNAYYNGVNVLAYQFKLHFQNNSLSYSFIGELPVIF